MLIDRFKKYLYENHPVHAHNKWMIAVSGGVDSVVLCDLAYKAGFDFVIAHCNFQLRGEESQRDEGFVRSLASKYGKEVYVKQFDTTSYAQQHKKSIQVAARELRYKWFYEVVNGKWSMVNSQWSMVNSQWSIVNDDASTNNLGVVKGPGEGLQEGNLPGIVPQLIVTAHHANDNIETLLMNFFKGTGISGLHGILPLQQKIFRPLLPFRKEELQAYAVEHNLAFVEDSSNLSDKYTRNFFRQHLMPLLKEVYPQVEANLLHNIQRFTEVELLYQQAIELHKKKLLEYKGNEVHIPLLKLEKSAPLRSIIYEIIKDFGFSVAQADEVKLLLTSESGRFISSGTYRIIRNRKWLIISPKESTAAINIIIEQDDQEILFENGKLTIDHIAIDGRFIPPNAVDVCCVDSTAITYPLLLRKWKQGDYFYPLGMKKKKKLSRFFIDKKLSKTDKEKVWVLEVNKKIVWVIGLRIDERFKVEPFTKEVLQIRWTR